MEVFRLLLPLGRLAGGKTRLFADGQSQVKRRLKEIEIWRDGFASDQKLIWFHCASLGEFEQGRPVLEDFKSRNPNFKVLLTFFSPSGYEVRKNYSHADFITYLPLDTSANAHAFVQASRPDLVVFVKYEFWPYFINEIKRSKAQLVGISVILRKNQSFFKPYGGFFKKSLTRFDYLFVQNQVSGNLLRSIGYDAFEVVGDTRFDRVLATAADNSNVPGIQEFLGHSSSKTMVVGSAWPEDMDVLVPFILKHPEMKFIIAPHEIKKDQINSWAEQTGAIRYSDYNQFQNQNVLIIDSIGLLSKLYKYADYAFVGGGFKTGLHNILEPAVFGVPIFFGNQKYKKFQEAIDLLDLGVAFTVNKSLDKVLEGLDLNAIRHKAEQYVSQNSGATRAILHHLESLST